MLHNTVITREMGVSSVMITKWIGRLETEGFDFGFTCTTKEFVWGKVDIEFKGNYIQRYVIQNLPDQPFIARAGRDIRCRCIDIRRKSSIRKSFSE
jgi:hypothetical protein